MECGVVPMAALEIKFFQFMNIDKLHQLGLMESTIETYVHQVLVNHSRRREEDI